MSYFFPELLSKLEFEAMPVNAVPDLPASLCICPVHGAEIHLTFWMEHRRLASKEETHMTIPTQSHDNSTFIISNLISFTFAKRVADLYEFEHLIYTLSYDLLTHHCGLRFRVGLGIEPHFVLQIVCFLTNHIVRNSYEIATLRLGWIVHCCSRLGFFQCCEFEFNWPYSTWIWTGIWIRITRDFIK